MTDDRFTYVAYDKEAVDKQNHFRTIFEQLAVDIYAKIKSPRERSLALTNLEQTYMWIGRGLREDLLFKTHKKGTP